MRDEDDIPPLHRDRIAQAGAAAARAGKERRANPWLPGSPRARLWAEAWQREKKGAQQ